MRAINEIIIHCSASDSRFYDFPAIKKDHVKNRGWQDIGYHLGVDYEGRVHFLRPIEKPGAHTQGRNAYSVGICLLGYERLKARDSWALLQFEALARLLKFLMPIWGLTLDDVNPHSKYSNKECPAFDLDWFKQKYME